MARVSNPGGGILPTIELVNNPPATTTIAGQLNAKVVTPATAVGGTLHTAFSLTGRGRLALLAVRTNNATAKTLRAKLTVDGVVIIDHTTGSISTSGNGFFLADPSSGPIEFRNSCLLEVCSSIVETGVHVQYSGAYV